MTITRSAAGLAAAACLAVLTGCASHAAAPGTGATRSPSTSTAAPAPTSASTPLARLLPPLHDRRLTSTAWRLALSGSLGSAGDRRQPRRALAPKQPVGHSLVRTR